MLSFSTLNIKRLLLLCAFFLLAGIAFSLFLFSESLFSKKLRVTFFDVGQGDSILIELPSHQRILVDGGPDDTVLRKLAKMIPWWDRRIDLVVNTHPEADHITGLVSVLKRYTVDAVAMTGVSHTTDEYRAWLSLIKQKGIPVSMIEGEQTIALSQTNGIPASLEILYPRTSVRDAVVPVVNNTSIIAKLTYGETSFLLTGDVEMSVEKELLDAEVDLSATVLKIGHHGSSTSTSVELVEAVEPEYAVISAGRKNRFGHPSLRTVRRLERADVTILRTDQHGDVRFMSDGDMLEVQTEKRVE